MPELSSWITENPLLAAVVIIFGAPFAIAGLALIVGPIIVLTEASALLGFFALFMIAFFGYFTAALVMDDDEESDTVDDSPSDPVTKLEHRYVEGELTDEEFERRLERIIETEDTIERRDGESPLVGRTRPERETELN